MIDGNDLLDAVDAITRPQAGARWQQAHTHTWSPCAGWHGLTRCTDAECALSVCEWCDAVTAMPDYGDGRDEMIRYEDKPLLEQLHDAITSDVGGNGGAGKPARERMPLDVGAFEVFEDIDGRVRSWLADMGGRTGKAISPAQALRSWYVLFTATNPELGDVQRKTLEVEGWSRRILDVLAPPKKIEITAPCPICGKEWVNRGLKLEDGRDDPDAADYVRALVAVERDSLDDSYAMCAACDKVWRGTGQMRALRIAIDDASDTRGHGGDTLVHVA